MNGDGDAAVVFGWSKIRERVVYTPRVGGRRPMQLEYDEKVEETKPTGTNRERNRRC